MHLTPHLLVTLFRIRVTFLITLFRRKITPLQTEASFSINLSHLLITVSELSDVQSVDRSQATRFLS
jgi:hypothetical protein